MNTKENHKAPPELKPCPFCGEEAVLVRNRDGELGVFCGLGICSAFYKRFATVEQWNTRSSLPAANAECGDLPPSVAQWQAAMRIVDLLDGWRELDTWISEWDSKEEMITAVAAMIPAVQPDGGEVVKYDPDAQGRDMDKFLDECNSNSIALMQGAEAMRRACIEKVKEMSEKWLADALARGSAFSDKAHVANEIIAALEENL